MKPVLYESDASDDLATSAKSDLKILKKVIELIDSIRRNPFKGLGKPEPLKHNHQGYLSRRINDEHRLIYKVEQDKIIIVSCRNHYYYNNTS